VITSSGNPSAASFDDSASCADPRIVPTTLIDSATKSAMNKNKPRRIVNPPLLPSRHQLAAFLQRL
jgi:hypothetical protein